jgi:hypothetical protein
MDDYRGILWPKTNEEKIFFTEINFSIKKSMKHHGVFCLCIACKYSILNNPEKVTHFNTTENHGSYYDKLK